MLLIVFGMVIVSTLFGPFYKHVFLYPFLESHVTRTTQYKRVHLRKLTKLGMSILRGA